MNTPAKLLNDDARFRDKGDRTVPVRNGTRSVPRSRIGHGLLAFTLCCSTFWASAAPAAEPVSAWPAPAQVTGADFPSDDGASIYLAWEKMPYDDVEGAEYVIERAAEANGPFEEVRRVKAASSFASDIDLPFWMWSKDATRHTVKLEVPDRPVPEAEKPKEGESSAPSVRDSGRPYVYRVRPAIGTDLGAPSESVAVASVENWFAWQRVVNLACVLLFSGIVLFFLEYAKRRRLFLRQIPGLAAVDEAIGRATEMGRPVLFMTGRLDMDNISTIAATIVLGEVAKKTARYDVELDVPHSFSVTMAVSREITRTAYLEAGRPDSYNDEINHYVTEEQFSFAAAVNGQMLRRPPGAVFYMGYYYAESLLMAEAGATTGAIQIAGTDSESQLPFFVTTCDYTLMGEELFAATAYLSRKPELVGTLRAQDLGKFLIMLVLIAGTAAATFCSVRGYSTMWLSDLLRPS